MPPDIIKQQQEVAREYVNNNPIRGVEYQGNLDTLVATIIANIGRELEARCEGEKYEWLTPEEMKEHDGCRYHKNGLFVGQVAGDNYNQAIDHTITLIRTITGISPTR